MWIQNKWSIINAFPQKWLQEQYKMQSTCKCLIHSYWVSLLLFCFVLKIPALVWNKHFFWRRWSKCNMLRSTGPLSPFPVFVNHLQGWWLSCIYILLHLSHALIYYSVLHLGQLYFYQALTCIRVCQYFIKMLLKTAFFHLFIEADYIVFELCLNWRYTHVKTVIFITHT